MLFSYVVFKVGIMSRCSFEWSRKTSKICATLKCVPRAYDVCELDESYENCFIHREFETRLLHRAYFISARFQRPKERVCAYRQRFVDSSVAKHHTQHSDTIKHFPFYFIFFIVSSSSQSSAFLQLTAALDRFEWKRVKTVFFFKAFQSPRPSHKQKSQTSLNTFFFIVVDTQALSLLLAGFFWEVEIALVLFVFEKFIFLANARARDKTMQPRAQAQVRRCRLTPLTFTLFEYSNNANTSKMLSCLQCRHCRVSQKEQEKILESSAGSPS